MIALGVVDDPRPGMMLNIADGTFDGTLHPCLIRKVLDHHTVTCTVIETRVPWMTFKGRLALPLERHEFSLDKGRFARFSKAVDAHKVQVTLPAHRFAEMVEWINEHTYQRWRCDCRSFYFENLADATYFKLMFVGE